MSQIMIISVDPMLRALFVEALGEQGHQVSGDMLDEHAWSVISARQPDLVLVQISRRATATGWSLLERLHAGPATRRLPVLVYSVDRHALHERSILLRAYGYPWLVLPTTVDQMYAAVAAALAPQPAYAS